MKKILAVLLCPLLLFSGVVPAAAVSVPEEREYLDDGSYFVETLFDSVKEEKEETFFSRLFAFFRKLMDFFRGQKTVSKTGYLNYYSSAGELLWTAKLKGNFICSKNSVKCVSADFSVDIYDTDWSLLSSDARAEGDTASADFSIRQQKLLIPLKTIEKSITLTCDKNGNVKLK